MKPADIKRIAESAKASGLRILEHYLPGGKAHGKEYVVLNPHRDDKEVGNLSVNIASGKGGDFASGPTWGDFVGMVAFALRCKPGEAAEELARFLGVNTGATVPPAPIPVQTSAKWHPITPVPDTAPPPPMAHPTKGKPDHIAPYIDDAGRLDGYIYRWNKTAARKKTFSYLTWGVDAAGRNKWDWKDWKHPRPFYGRDLIAQRPDADLVICEGEVKTEAARALLPESVVVCWASGSENVDKADFSPCKGHTVLLWADHDESGRKAMQAAAKSAKKAGAKSVRFVNLALFAKHTVNAKGQIIDRLADLPVGWDAADALAEGWTPQALAELLAREDALLDSLVAEPNTDTEPATNTSAPTGRAAESGPFELDDELGLFYIETDKDGKVRQTRICAPVRVPALARDAEGGAWSPVIEYRDRDRQQRREVIPFRMFLGDGNDGAKQLADLGLEIASGRQALDRLKSYIIGSPTTERALQVDKTGWHGRAFATTEGAIGETDETLLFRGSRRAHGVYTSKGKLTDWQGHIANPAINNPRLMFALAASFAGPLLKPLGMQGCAFHFVGDSSTGKSGALHAAGSTWGSTDAQVHSWRATDNALEYVAAQHNDALLILDELREVDPKSAGAITYMLTNAKGKGRAHHAGGLRETVSWRIVMLSSGELGLADHLASAGQKHYAGQEVRFIEIDADAGAGHGMWSDVGACIGGGKQFTDSLKKFANRYYGTAGRAFLVELVKDKNLNQLPTWWRSHESAFAEQHKPKDAGGQVLRVMSAFCLVGFAGELAARFEVVPWPRGAALSAAGQLFKEWQQARPTSGNSEEGKMLAHVRTVMERNWQSRFIDWGRATGTRREENRDEKGDFDPDISHMPAVHDALGFRKPDIPFNVDNPKYFFYVTRSRFAEEFATKAGFKPKRVAAVLKKHGALRCDNDGTTHRETLPNGDYRSYCIIGKKLWSPDE